MNFWKCRVNNCIVDKTISSRDCCTNEEREKHFFGDRKPGANQNPLGNFSGSFAWTQIMGSWALWVDRHAHIIFTTCACYLIGWLQTKFPGWKNIVLNRSDVPVQSKIHPLLLWEMFKSYGGSFPVSFVYVYKAKRILTGVPKHLTYWLGFGVQDKQHCAWCLQVKLR